MPERSRLPLNPRRLRKAVTLASLVLLALITVTAAIVFDAIGLGMEPGLYDPARGALVEAEWQLEHRVPRTRARGDRADATQLSIRSALEWLDKAEGADRQRGRIAALRDKVEELEAADRAARTTADRRARVYRRVVAELKSLIGDLRDGPAARAPDSHA